MTTVVALPNCRIPDDRTPQRALVQMLQDLVVKAESGELQSFVGTGFTAEGLRLAAWCDFHPDVYQMRGALAWLQDEYVARHSEANDG